MAKQRQVGHAGTLDPLATGVLVLVLGTATRLSSYVMEAAKVYCAEVILGATTLTDDAEGTLQSCADPSHLHSADVLACIQGFVGTISQVPPRYSAVKRNGQKLYVLARKGIEVQPEPRMVEIHGIHVESWNSPRLRLRIDCGSGTYIRSLARDIGAALGVGGYLHALRRVQSGRFTVDECHSLHVLDSQDALLDSLFPPDVAVLDYPAVVLDEPDVRRIRLGQAVHLRMDPHVLVRLYNPQGTLVGLGTANGSEVRGFRVLGEGDPIYAGRA